MAITDKCGCNEHSLIRTFRIDFSIKSIALTECQIKFNIYFFSLDFPLNGDTPGIENSKYAIYKLLLCFVLFI